MSQTDLQQEVSQLKEKLDKTQKDFQNYKEEAKKLEEYLQQESSKKQAEIRKSKQELIRKDKELKQIKQQLSLLQTEHHALKTQNAKTIGNNQQASKTGQQMKQLQQQLSALQSANSQLAAKLVEKQNKLMQITNESNKERSEWQAKVTYLNNELDVRADKIQVLQQQKNKLIKQSNIVKSKTDIPKKQTELERISSKKQVQVLRVHFDKERDIYEQKIRKLQQTLVKYQKNVKQAKMKIHHLVEQNQMLQSRTVNVTINSLTSSPSPMLIKSSLQDQDLSIKPSFHCLLLTKPHYISPFLQIYEQKNLIKIYKSSRSGCFQKSMGCYKHRFDKIAFDHDSLLEPIITRIKEYEEQTQHSIFMFGVKKSNKKYLMSKLVVGLKQFLLEKLQYGQEIEAVFVKRSVQQQKNLSLKSSQKEEVIQIIDKVISLGYKSEKKDKVMISPRKGQSKPKVRYFKIKIGDFCLEIGTSSFTSLSFRQKVSVTSMINNILYSKLPNILQSSLAQKYIVLCLNPIVDLYEDCKNTLSTTFCRATEEVRDEFEPTENINRSPIRQQLNDIAKKKLQGFERLNEQSSLKMRRLQDECALYKARFDELQFRLKNLLNTHAGQNTYLKKSPVTLSYEKLLKFVHSVQSRNGGGTNLSHNQSQLLKTSNIYNEKDCESMQAL